MSGFDTLYDNGFEDGEIAEIAATQGRIVLTRDRELLKRRIISHGCYVHALKPRCSCVKYTSAWTWRVARGHSACAFIATCRCTRSARNSPVSRVPLRVGALIRTSRAATAANEFTGRVRTGAACAHCWHLCWIGS